MIYFNGSKKSKGFGIMVKNSSSKRGVSGRRVALVGTLSALVMASGGIWYDSKMDYDKLESTYNMTKSQLLKQEGKVSQQEKEIKNLNSNLKTTTEAKELVSKEKEVLAQEKKSLIQERDILMQEKQNLESELKAEREKESIKKAEADAKDNSQKKESKGVASAGYENWEKMTVEATGYSSYEAGDELAGQWGGLTAMGTKARVGVVAVDPNVIPLGTTIYIPSIDATFVAEDTGSAIKGSKIDIFMRTLAECNNWGRRSIEIYVHPK